MEKEKVFNFNEAFQEAYEEFLIEREEVEAAELFEMLAEGIEETEKTFKLVEEYFSAFGKSELNEAFDATTSASLKGNLMDLIGSLQKMVSSSGAYADTISDKSIGYETVSGIEDAKRFQDLKFPKNILVFLRAIIKWLWGFVLFAIRKIKSFFIKEKDPSKLRIKRFRETLDDMVNGARKIEKFGKPAITGAPTTIQAYTIDSSRVPSLNYLKEASIINFDVLSEETVPAENRTTQNPPEKRREFVPKTRPATFISIDLTKDMMSLKELTKHFFNLFDNATGSSNEKLFGTDDLTLLLNIFQQTLKGISKGIMPAQELSGDFAEIDAIDASRAKDNLINTSLNLNALKKAYAETSSRIMDIGEIIGHKQLILSSNLGVAFQFYSSATCNEMLALLDILEPRMKDAIQKEKALTKVEKQYEDVVKQLESLSQSFMAVSSITFTTIYQRKISQLLQASRFLTQTVTLRLTSLALYIKQMKDIENMLESLMTIAGGKRNITFFQKFKQLFKK